MNKKIFLLILIPALVLIGAYLFVRSSLNAAVQKDRQNFSTTERKTDSGVGSTKVDSAMDLRPLFIERMQQLVAKTSNSIYKLSVGRIEVDVLMSTVSLYDVAIRPDKKRASLLQKIGLAPADIFSFSFQKLQIENINLDDALTSKSMDYKTVKLTRPVFEIFQSKQKVEKPKEEFTQRFLKEMRKLSVQRLIVEEGKIVIHGKKKVNVLNGVAINMKNILVDSATRKATDRFLFAKEADLSFNDYKIITGKEQYNLTIGKVKVQAPQKKLTLTNIAFKSPFSKEEFSHRQKFAKEYYRFSIPSINITGVDWWQFINEEEVIAQQVTINGGNLFVYLDRSLPPKSKMGNFPFQLLMKLPMKMKIEQLKMDDMDLTYEEYNPLSKQSGIIYMDNINMSAKNISNGPQGSKQATVAGSALFMHQIPIHADFIFNRTDASGKFTAAINIEKGFDGRVVNPFAMPLGLMEIERGTVQKLEANIQGNEQKASGNVTLLYKDLKLGLLEKDKGAKNLDKKSVTSLLANAIVLKNDNPKKGQAPRKESIEFTRIPEGGFFMLVWKTMMAGVLKTIGAPPKIASKTVNK